jgi:hypothetical protein
MAVCDVSQNAAVPAWLTPLASAGIAVTPAMQQWAAGFANDLTIPVNSVRTAWFDGKPIAAWINCHSYTVVQGQQIPGAYHGASLYLVNDPAYYPPTALPAPMETVNWALVGISGAAIAGVVGLFFVALSQAGRASTARRRDARGSTPRRS